MPPVAPSTSDSAPAPSTSLGAGPSTSPGTLLPRWASVLDLLTLILLAATLLLLAFGGVRFRVAGIRISIMSAWRPFLGALAVAAVRHALVRREPVYARALAWAAATRASEAYAASWPVFVVTRLALLAVGYFAVITFGYPDRVPPFRVYENELHNLPARWDTGWYLAIATAGYGWSAEVTGQQNIAFFPAYPVLMRIVGRLLRDETLWAGVVISLAAFFAALIYFYRLARRWLDHAGASAATALLAAYPFALFFSAAYTEALFLLAALGAFYHVSRDQPLAAGAWGLLAGLTRPNGCLLAIPLAFLIVEERRRLGQPPPPFDRRGAAQLAAAAMPVAGMAIFSAFVFRLTGNPLEWARTHQAWGRTFRGVHRIVLDRYDFISEYGLYEYTVSLPVDVLNGAAAVFAIAMIWPVWKRMGRSYAVFLLVTLVPPLAMGGLLSIGRVTSVLFPMFIVLGQMVGSERRQPWLIGFAMLQAFFAALFFTWRPLY